LNTLCARVIQPVVSQDSAYGHMSSVVEGDRLVVRWKGDVPAEASAAVEKARKVAPVEIRAADHSRAELDAVADELVEVSYLRAAASFAAVTRIAGVS
jgi:hypothetical protein